MFSLGNGWCFYSEQLLIARSGCDVHNISNIPDTDSPSIGKPTFGTTAKLRIDRLGICPTNNCNLRCVYCSGSSREGSTDYDYDDFMSAIGEFFVHWVADHILDDPTNNPFQIVVSGGGEPTYDWNRFEHMIKDIKHNADIAEVPLKISLTTNGMIEDESHLGFIAKNFDNILISYDGLHEIQNANRISPYYDDPATIVEHTISYLSKIKKISIRSTVWPENLPRLQEMIDNLHSLCGGLNNIEWSLCPVAPVGRGAVHMSGRESFNYSFFRYYHSLMEYSHNKYEFDRISSPLFVLKPIDTFCGAFGFDVRSAWICSDGRIVSCLDYINMDEIAHVDSGKVMFNENYDDVILRKYQETYESCKVCIAYRFCKGGCPAKHLNSLNPYDSVRRWECESNVELWHHILNELCKNKESYGWYAEQSHNNPNVLLMKRRE